MSTIASPRDPSTPLGRRIAQGVTTPTSSSRPSLDVPRSLNSSPNPTQPNAAGGASAAGGALPSKRSNRAALREYYNLKKAAGASGSGTSTPILEVTPDALGDGIPGGPYYASEVAPSELDQSELDVEAYVRQTLAESSLEELLRVYTRVLGEIRALDAEKKALVYDNYSKLISATETIRKVSTFEY
jgi:vacuolar protein sorting-associated protein 51